MILRFRTSPISKLITIITLAVGSLLLGLSPLPVFQTQAASESRPDDVPGEIREAGSPIHLSGLSAAAAALPAAASIDAAATSSCDPYYFHDETTDVGSDGNKSISNSTPPTSETPTEAEESVPILGLGTVELMRFYSDPVLSGDMYLTNDDIGGTVWLQSSDFANTVYIAEVYDYNPAGGTPVLIGDVEFAITSDGPFDASLIIEPPDNTIIPAGHRLLFILSAKSTLETLVSPTVNFFYDGTNRASHFTVCRLTPPSLTISKSGPATAIAGQTITYTLTVTNSGGVSATNLIVSDTLPAGAFYVGGGSQAGNVVTWSILSLAGFDTSIQRSFAVTASDTITNSAYQVTADDDVSATGQKSVTTQVSQPGQPNLTISKSGPSSVASGAEITYRLTVFNGGDITATNLLISDTIPDNASYVSGGAPVGNDLIWDVAELGPGQEIEKTFTVTASGTITNRHYRVTADAVSAEGQTEVTTAVNSQQDVYLPLVIKGNQVTTLKIDSVNTEGISLVRVIEPGSGNELLSCTNIGNNVTVTCGNFASVGTYRIIAHTNRCGILQGDFHDAIAGATVTRTVFCN